MASTDIENNICEAIEYIVNNAVENAGYDKTIQATIVNVVDQTIGKYKIKYQDSTFIAYAQSTDVTYVNGAEVYVLIPGNDMTRDKTILGTTKKLGANYTATPEGDEAFEVIGTNCIESKDSFELCSYLSNMVQIVYDKSNTSNNKINLNLQNVETYLKQSSSIICGATFKTSLPTEQQFRGNYGIVFELNFQDNGAGNIVTKNYVVDVNQMTGNPYKITHDTRHYGIFDIDGDNFIDINKIYLFVYDFPNKATDKPADIFIKNLEISGAVALSAEELSSCALTFITPQGIYFDDNDLDSAIRTIQAQVRVKGKVIDNNSQQLTYYWFVENVGISTSSEEYNKYGGPGWKCLNLHNVIKPAENGEAPVVEWVPGEYQYEVKKSDSAAKETRYKCVAIYDSIILSKEITIINYSSNYLISIESDVGTKFYYDIGTPTLTCKINNKEQTGDDYTYIWAEVDNNNNFFSLSQTTEANNEYNNAVAAYNNLKQKIENEQAMAAASQAQLDNYLTIIEKYDNIMRVEENKLIKVQINTITNFSTYKCSVYYKGTYIGTSSIVLTNSLEAEDIYTLIINNGSQVFKYNENGIAPTSNTVENPYEILPLTFVVYDNLGNQIPQDVIEKCNIKWIVPTENTMLDIPNTFEPSKTGVDLINNTETYSNLLSLTYTINNKYNVAKLNNNIQLVVDYKGMSLTAKTNFTFAKEGDPGTNGTEFLCRLVPNVASGKAPLYPMLLNGTLNYIPKQSGRWLKVQLWHNGEMIFDGTESGTTTEGKTLAIVWSILRNKYTTSIYDNTDVSINATTGACTYSGYTNNSAPANIIKCALVYDGVEYYATMPIITAKANSGYTIQLKDNTGFRFATYSADGRRPQYDNTNPFELIVTQVINGVKEDISQLESTYAIDYNWNIRGKIYNPVSKKWDLNTNLGLKNRKDTYTLNPIYFKPLDNYTGECVNNALECVVSRGGNELGRIHIPIHLLLNKYGQAAINAWDGNSVSIDKNGNGVILAPQIGAGKKESDNSFTGMLMGQVKEAGQSNADVGLIGYHAGVRTLHLSAYDGYAIFGKQGPGQIILDPSSDKALLYSNNFWEDYHDDNSDTKKNGLPKTTYVYNETSKTYNGQSSEGMIIDLTTPRILFGSGNFRVDPNGYIYAKGGGNIAGWYIDDHNLWSGNANKDNADTIRFGNENFTRTINGDSRNNLRLALGRKFAVTNEGTMYAGDAIIGTGTNKITIGKSSGDATRSALYSGSKTALHADATGFYLGTDGISLGKLNDYSRITGKTSPDNHGKFEVHSDGTLYAKNGYFDGKIIAESGKVGGWTIGSTYLRGDPQTSGGTDYIQINSNGSITSPKWSLSRNGAASFSSVTITGGSLNINDKFKVTSEGHMTSISGNIGGWNIDSVQLQKTTGSYSFEIRTDRPSNEPALLVYHATDGYQFYVRPDGYLYAKSASITGNITATSGTFTNCTINGSCTIGGTRVDGDFVKSSNISAGAVTASKISAGAVTASKLNVDSLSAISAQFGDKVYFGSGSYVDGSSNGMQWTNNVGFLTMGLHSSHPYMSAVNVSSVNGISFRDSSSVTSTGSQNGSIKVSGSTMILDAGVVRIDGSIGTYYGGNNHVARGYTYLQVQTGVTQTARLTFYNGLLCVATGDTGISGVGF